MPIESAHPPYDPRARPWYKAATEHTNAVWTSAIRFHEGREGVTMAKPLYDSAGRLLGVFTADFYTEQIASFLDTLRAGQRGFCFAKHADGALILPTRLPPATRVAFEQEHVEIIRQWHAARSKSPGHSSARVRFGGETYLLSYREPRAGKDSDWHCGVMLPEREFTAPVAHATRLLFALAAAIAAIGAAAGAAAASRLSRTMRDITAEMQEISAGRLRPHPCMESGGLREAHVLCVAIEQMKEALQQNARLLSAVDQAERANRIKSDVLAMVAHDLRSPLQAIKGHGELLRMNAADANESWAAIERACHTMEQHVQNMLNLSRLEAGRLPVERISFPVAEVIHRSHGAVSLAARAKSLAIRMVLTDPNLTMRSDPNRIEQILTNLLSNAVKYTSEGWIEVVCKRGNGDVEFCVSDTGPGMTPEEVERAFEPFSQGAAGRKRADSVGLGLAICKKLTQRLGGTPTVESAPGKGTRFYVRLPRDLPDTVAHATGFN
jgi:signal transduction histidine kinase